MSIVHTLLVLLAQLSGCASAICASTFLDEPFATERLPVTMYDIQDVAPLGDDEFIVVAGRRASAAVDVIRVGRLGEETVAAVPGLSPTDAARSVVVNEGRWWFSRGGDHETGWSVYFTGSDGATRRVDHPLSLWLAIRGPEPRGVLIAVQNQQPALDFRLVTPSGIEPLAVLDWWQDGRWLQTPVPGHWEAEAMGDGRIAVIAADGPNEDAILILRILGDGPPRETTLRCSIAAESIAAAADGSGRLAIVAHSREGELVAMIVDPDDPESVECRPISSPGEGVAAPPIGSPWVAWTGDRFVAAWLRDDGRLRACELSNAGDRPVIVDVGDDADVRRPLRQAIHSDAESLTFMWKDRRGDVIVRTLPRDLAAVAVLAELQRRFCEAFGRMDEPYR